MLVLISLQRKKCIGCSYCVEFSPNYFVISKKDGKSTLIRSKKKSDFFILKQSIDYEDYILNKKAQKVCPVKIIDVKLL